MIYEKGKTYYSPTQLETADLCLRKWLLERVKKMPTVRKDHFGFGTCMHGVCERFLKGESNLYPKDWDIDPDNGRRLDPKESALIVVLIQKAIDAGYLEARPGGEVEKEFEIKVSEQIRVVGKIDHRTKIRVEDHKHSKSWRYMKSAKALMKSIQMMTYGKERLENFKRLGEVPSDVITLAHNQFLKDYNAPEVGREEAEVTALQIEEFWNSKILPLIGEMERARKIENPFDIPDPGKDACNAYGGCPYQTICSGAEELPVYKRRIDSINLNLKREIAMTDAPVKPVSPSDFFAQRKLAAAAAAKPTVAINPPPPAAMAPMTAAAPKPATANSTPPPWYCSEPPCPACKARGTNPGFNLETGKPCRICISMSKIKPDEAGFEWSIGKDGTTSWWKKGEKVAETAAPVAGDAGSKTVYTVDDLVNQIKNCTTVEQVLSVTQTAETVVGDNDLKVIMQIAEAKMEQLETFEVAAAEVAAEAKPTLNKLAPIDGGTAAAPAPAEAAPPKRGPGRPRKNVETTGLAQVAATESYGLVLLIGCTSVKAWPGREVLFAEDFLSKVEGYWSDDKVFERRGRIRTALQEKGEFVNALKDKVIVQTSRDPDVDNLISSLLPHAGLVIRGTVQ